MCCFKQNNTEQLVRKAISTGNMVPVFELYRNAADDDKPQTAYQIADAAFKITIEEVCGKNNREFLRTLFYSVNNAQNAELHIEAGGKDEYMAPFVALVKYAYVQTVLSDLKTYMDSEIKNSLISRADVSIVELDPHNIDVRTNFAKPGVDRAYFKELLWKKHSLQKVYKPLEGVKKDLQAMYNNLKLLQTYYKEVTPNIDFGGLKFNSTEAEFYSKVALKMEKGTGTIHTTKVFANGVVVDFVPFFPNLVQDSVTFTDTFADTSSNGIKMGDSIAEVQDKMKPYYLLRTDTEWVTYLVPNGQTFSFRFVNGYLNQIMIREAPGWKG